MFEELIMEILHVNKLNFSYGERSVLRNLSFSLKKGEITALIGASGSGKTTLFRLLTGILMAESGSITIAGRQQVNCHENVAYMMQEDLLLPWRTVLRNILLPEELGSSPTRILKEEAHQLLREIGLAECEAMYPHQLSGGMRQRVALARALLQKRPLLLLDEPFGSLDVSLREQMYTLLRQIQAKKESTMLLITHDFRDALSLADRALLLANGSIAQEWSIQEDVRHNPYATAKMLEEMRSAIIGKKDEKRY